MAKMRQVNKKDDFMFLKRYTEMESNPTVKKCTSLSFLALSLLFRTRKETVIFEKNEDIEKQREQFKNQPKNIFDSQV